MKTSSICLMLCACVLLLVLCVASTVAAPPNYYSLGNFKSFPKRQPLTECDRQQSVSHICYQCGKTHIDQLDQIYARCCSEQGAMRSYCNKIYTEPPKRGGLWL